MNARAPAGHPDRPELENGIRTAGSNAVDVGKLEGLPERLTTTRNDVGSGGIPPSRKKLIPARSHLESPLAGAGRITDSRVTKHGRCC